MTHATELFKVLFMLAFRLIITTLPVKPRVDLPALQ